MGRHGYKIFSQGQIGNLTLPNRLVRSATWEPSIINSRQMSDEVLDLYEKLAIGGVGLIVTGGFPVFQGETPGGEDSGAGTHPYDAVQIEGLGGIADVVHRSNPDCKVVAQLETGHPAVGPSAISSPFLEETIRPLSAAEVRSVVDCFVEAIARMKALGFDGVQLHAAHGGLLSCFLSPYTNRRDDAYGGSVKNRARMVREIVSGAREKVGDFPILIKMNGTDYVPGGIDVENLPELAQEIQSCGVDAIEVSGGMWDCLARTEEELGFRPVPAPESHTRIKSPDKQSYFLKYAERLDLDIPVILVGGNRDVERLEEIVRGGKVDFVALCRPLISEPDLPRRWLEGQGKNTTDCISCNACLYDMYEHPGRPEFGLVRCVFKHDKQGYKMAQRWLASWVEENIVS